MTVQGQPTPTTSSEGDIVAAIRALAYIINNANRALGKLPVEFKVIREGAREPVRAEGNAAYDLFCPDEVIIQAGQTVKIPMGFACKLPLGFHAIVNVRSSTWQNYGISITNSTAIFDNKFCGDEDEYTLQFHRPAEFVTPVVIHKGERIAQLQVVPDCPEIEWIRKETLGQPNRGGFGSTGK